MLSAISITRSFPRPFAHARVPQLTNFQVLVAFESMHFNLVEFSVRIVGTLPVEQDTP